MRVSFQILIIAIIVTISGLVIYLWHPDRPPFYLVAGQLRKDEVELEQVLKWANDKGVVWIDARSRQDYEKSHVDGAFLLNEMEDFYKLLEPIWSEIQNKADLPFIVYCSSESCLASRKVSEKLRETVGIAEVYILEGGLKSLIDRGLIK